jgi:hypothetical protein
MADQFVAPYVPDFTNVIINKRNYEEDQRRYNQDTEIKKKQLKDELDYRNQQAMAEIEARRQQNEATIMSKELEELTNIDKSYLTVAQNLKDPKSLASIIKMRNSNPLVKKHGSLWSETDFENADLSKRPTGKTATDPLAKWKQVATIDYSNANPDVDVTSPEAQSVINTNASELAKAEGKPESAYRGLAIKLTETRMNELQDLDKSLMRQDQAIAQISKTGEDQFGAWSNMRLASAKWANELGIDVSGWQDLDSAKKALENLSLAELKPTLGSQFTEREGAALKEAVGSITTPKEAILVGLKVRKLNSQYMKNRNILETALVNRNPSDMGTVSAKINKLNDFPKQTVRDKKIFDPNDKNRVIGTKKEYTTFYEFADMLKRDKGASFTEALKAWESLVKRNDPKAKFPVYSPSDKQLLNEVW